MPTVESYYLPSGPALPPNRGMRFKTKFLRVTTLRLINENVSAAVVTVDGTHQYVSGAVGISAGLLDLSGAWYFGKPVTIINESDWVLRVEY